MRVLAFDTATPVTAVALRDIETDANVCLRASVDLAVLDVPSAGDRPAHAQKLLVLIGELLHRAEAGWEAVDRIAVGTGPGTFTGMRIGIATAQALSRATGIPLVGVSTLRALALGAHDCISACATLAVIDARRGEAFVAGWRCGADPIVDAPATGPSVLAPQQLAGIAANAGAPTLAVGDGSVRFREVLESVGIEVPADGSSLHRVSAREHCRIATLQTPTANGLIQPDYLRLPDAETAAKS
jgi:tRNA threonylcarbamoyladenosine biosynthesis protein TsaB